MDTVSGSDDWKRFDARYDDFVGRNHGNYYDDDYHRILSENFAGELCLVEADSKRPVCVQRSGHWPSARLLPHRHRGSLADFIAS